MRSTVFIAMLVEFVLMLIPDPAAAGPSQALHELAEQASERCLGRKGVEYFNKVNILCIEGEIDIEGKLAAEIASALPKRGVMVVMTSPGGGVSQAIRISEFLERRHYTIVVNGICASACAQFVFLAASHKYIVGQGIVAMHGGPVSNAQIDAMDNSPANKASLKAEQIRFREFYRKRKIDIRIITNAPPDVMKRIQNGEIVFWAPAREEFAKFGVRDVNFINATVMVR